MDDIDNDIGGESPPADASTDPVARHWRIAAIAAVAGLVVLAAVTYEDGRAQRVIRTLVSLVPMMIVMAKCAARVRIKASWPEYVILVGAGVYCLCAFLEILVLMFLKKSLLIFSLIKETGDNAFIAGYFGLCLLYVYRTRRIFKSELSVVFATGAVWLYLLAASFMPMLLFHLNLMPSSDEKFFYIIASAGIFRLIVLPFAATYKYLSSRAAPDFFQTIFLAAPLVVGIAQDAIGISLLQGENLISEEFNYDYYVSKPLMLFHEFLFAAFAVAFFASDDSEVSRNNREELQE